jgi:ABC-type dipeptide/oligopeptide/nickel transport system permease subunit
MSTAVVDVSTHTRPGVASRRWIRRLRGSRISLLGLILGCLLAAVVVVGPLIVRRDPLATVPGSALRPPLSASLLGTDELGRDVLSRLLHAGLLTLLMAVVAVGISVVAGATLGYVAGYVGGLVDTIIMRIMDSLMAFPPLLLAVLVAGSLGSGVSGAVAAIGLMGVPAFARVARAEALRIGPLEYVQAAKVAGVVDSRILSRHVVRNGLAPVIVLAAASMAHAILTAAALDFLGLGAAPPAPTWGGMLQSGFPYVLQDAWLGIIPGGAIAITALAFVFIGDGLRDVLDPRLDV